MGSRDLHRALSSGLFFYFMGKPIVEEESKRWFNKVFGTKTKLARYHFASKGFF